MRRLQGMLSRFTCGRAVALAAGIALTSTGVLAQSRGDERGADRAASEEAGAGTTLLERRVEIVEMANETIEDLQADPGASELYDEAYGYAVIDTTKGGLLVTGAGGTGVAKAKRGGEPVFMHVGGAGIGAGGGVANYKLVLLFEDEDAFEEFVDGDWKGGPSAQAAAGDRGVSTKGFVEGAAAFRIDESGLIAQAEVEGMRFWPSDRLN